MEVQSNKQNLARPHAYLDGRWPSVTKELPEYQNSLGAGSRGLGVHSDVNLASLDGPASIVLVGLPWIWHLGNQVVGIWNSTGNITTSHVIHPECGAADAVRAREADDSADKVVIFFCCASTADWTNRHGWSAKWAAWCGRKRISGRYEIIWATTLAGRHDQHL